MDVCCLVCGEPVDITHVREEYTVEQRRKFHAGQGCDSCNWGECAHCYGTGVAGDQPGGILRQFVNEQNGIAPTPCPVCNGTGRRQPTSSDPTFFFESLAESSDEDPMITLSAYFQRGAA